MKKQTRSSIVLITTTYKDAIGVSLPVVDRWVCVDGRFDGRVDGRVGRFVSSVTRWLAGDTVDR